MYTLLDCIKHKFRDSYVLYIPTVHTFRLVLLTHSFGTDTQTGHFRPLVKIKYLFMKPGS